ncbi:phosphoribosylglycinamide formyltransferase, partial [Thiolapillus sp.]
MSRLPVVVLISGGGTNLQAIIDAAERDLPIDIRAVISNKADAYGLERAKQAGIPTAVLEHQDFPDRESFDTALMELIDRYEPGLVLLAGFMRILTPDFVRHYHG